VSKGNSEVQIEVEERKFNDVTLVMDVPEDIDKSSLSSVLKSNLACGGTINDDGNIELQGDHRGRVDDLLEQEGFKLSQSQ
jgi:translation initiation factor 1